MSWASVWQEEFIQIWDEDQSRNSTPICRADDKLGLLCTITEIDSYFQMSRVSNVIKHGWTAIFYFETEQSKLNKWTIWIEDPKLNKLELSEVNNLNLTI
jgi:hypothetical protein